MEQLYCTTVYVRLKDKPKYEVHTYSHTVKEANAVIIANVKRDLIADIDKSFINGYHPTDEAIALNVERINLRLKGMK